jgi:hypothetical protein
MIFIVNYKSKLQCSHLHDGLAILLGEKECEWLGVTNKSPLVIVGWNKRFDEFLEVSNLLHNRALNRCK